MLQRLTHAAIAFAVTAVVYQAYAMTIVPWVAPPAERRAYGRQAAANYQPREAVHKFRDLLSYYFPANHWSLAEPPVTFENGKLMVVADADYEKRDNGELRVKRCLFLLFPDGWLPGDDPPRNAVVLEASGGALLYMDNAASPVSFGKFQRGQLLGAITIRSDMNDPGEADNLFISTRDLTMNESGINTLEAVEMRLGDHSARGKGLNIRLLPSDAEGRRQSAVGGIESLEIESEVAVDIAVDGVKWFQEGAANEDALAVDATNSKKPAESKTASTPAPPVRVRCQGSFEFDFANYIATFRDQVQVRQVYPDGKLDQLLADEVNLFFTRSKSPTDAASATKPRGEDALDVPSNRLASLEMASIEAKGAPVELDAASHEATARCERLRWQLQQRLITVDGGDDVELTLQGSKVHAAMVQYQMPPEGSNQQIGELLAAGGGWLQAVVDKQRPHEPLEVSWKRSMRLQRQDGQPVLSLAGRPKLSMVGVGRLWAEELHLYLREIPPEQQAAANVANGGAKVLTIVPDRMLARGRVAIDSSELTGKVNELALWINYEPDTPSSSDKSSNGKSRNDKSRNGSAEPRRADSLLNRRSRSRRSYGITGDRLTMQVAVRDHQPDVSNLTVDGNVVFQESSQESAQGSSADEQGPALRIVAGELRVDDADTPNALIQIRGKTDGRGRVLPAEITSRGTTLRTATLTINRGESRAVIDAPGEAEILSDRDLNGAPLAKPQPLNIAWERSMRLDGDRLTFAGNVMIRSASAWLQTKQLAVRLTAPVAFDGSASQAKPEIAQLDCQGGVLAEFDDRDAVGLTSHQRVELRSLAVNQISGEISGEGPGRIESVHLGKGDGSLNPLKSKRETPKNNPGQRLRYLRTDFVRSVAGNLHGKRVKLIGNVKTVYGPVDAWEQRLPLESAEGPGPNTVWIACDELEVAESPAGRLFTAPGANKNKLGPLELAAVGRVTIEGQDPERGAFTARGTRATYDQQKTLFVLEGKPATISHQQFVGAPFSDSTATKLMYWVNTGEVQGTGLRASLNQFDVGTKPKSDPPRR